MAGAPPLGPRGPVAWAWRAGCGTAAPGQGRGGAAVLRCASSGFSPLPRTKLVRSPMRCRTVAHPAWRIGVSGPCCVTSRLGRSAFARGRATHDQPGSDRRRKDHARPSVVGGYLVLVSLRLTPCCRQHGVSKTSPCRVAPHRLEPREASHLSCATARELMASRCGGSVQPVEL
jgi:hypothetical protein